MRRQVLVVMVVACGAPGKPTPAPPAARAPAPPPLACATSDRSIESLLGAAEWCHRAGWVPTHGGAWRSELWRYTFRPDGSYLVEMGTEIDPRGLVTREVTYQGGLSARGCWSVVEGTVTIGRQLPITILGPGRISVAGAEELRACPGRR